MEEKTKQAIIDATFLLMEHKDMNSISVREIANQANVNVATISYYFGGKYQLFTYLMEIYWKDLIKLCIQLLNKETVTYDDAFKFCKAFLKKEISSAGIIRSEQIMHQNYSLDDKTKQRVQVQFQTFQKLVTSLCKEKADEQIMLAKVVALISALSQPAYWMDIAAEVVGDVDAFMDIYVKQLIDQL